MIAAVEAGERVTLTVRGAPVADIVPHARRTRWLDGAWLEEELIEAAADPALADELDAAVGRTLEEDFSFDER
ncbi:MAG: type II toxin-antitoxin system prevent-host-death family antitoxin [Solirubrobacterales bacterium]|nr:type II toxin-antitoxin system prevent-host-death family antitoxin [Solirubrobacterales bacterium]